MKSSSLAAEHERHQFFCLDRRSTPIHNNGRQQRSTTHKRLRPVSCESDSLSPHSDGLAGAFAMKKSINRALNWLWEQHFPRLCLLCDQELASTSPDHLCRYCRLVLQFNVGACSSFAIPLQPGADHTTEIRLCQEPLLLRGKCLTKALADHAVVPLIPRSNGANLIHRLKFNQGESGVELSRRRPTDGSE